MTAYIPLDPIARQASVVQRQANSLQLSQIGPQIERVQGVATTVERELVDGQQNGLSPHQQSQFIQPHAAELQREVLRLKQLALGFQDQVDDLQTQVDRLQPRVIHTRSGLWKLIPHIPPEDTNPAGALIILIVVIALIFYLFIGAIAAAAASEVWRNIFCWLGLVFGIGVPGVLLWNWNQNRRGRRLENRKRKYSWNRANSCWTSFLTFLTLTIMYNWEWFPESQRKQISETYEALDKINFPAVAILEQESWSAQANLSDKVPSKCFLGHYDNSAGKCDGLTSNNAGSACNCTDSWDASIQSLEWQGAKYRYRNFRSDPALTSTAPTSMMLLQVFFTYDTSKNMATEGTVASPGLSLAVYDRSLSLVDALHSHLTTLTDINALGVSSVQLDIRERVLLNHSSFGKYAVSITSIPSLQLECDTANNADPKTACVTSIYLRAPTFVKTTETEGYELGWTDTVAYAGAFISFVQLVSWILSGLFWSA